jgi:hypothetical protein
MISVQAQYECDKCAASDTVDVDEDARASEELPDGWGWGDDADLLCPECYAEQQAEEEKREREKANR